MRLKWLRRLIGCRCADMDQQIKAAVERSQQPGLIIVMTDSQIAALEEKERLERLFNDAK